MKRVEIVISPTGATRIETKGFAGSDCRQASQFLEQALGVCRSETLTSEFYLPQTEQQPLREGQ